MTESFPPPDSSVLAVPTASIKVLKALSNPVRQNVFRTVETQGFARAADIAEALDLPANQISFHLRVLADAGMIKEAPEKARDKRDRVWTTEPGSWQLGSPESPVADEALGLVVGSWVTSEMHEIIRRVERWMPEVVTGRDAKIHGTLMNTSRWLTETEFTDLLDKINELLQTYEGAHNPGDEGTRRWQLAIIAADDEI